MRSARSKHGGVAAAGSASAPLLSVGAWSETRGTYGSRQSGRGYTLWRVTAAARAHQCRESTLRVVQLAAEGSDLQRLRAVRPPFQHRCQQEETHRPNA